MDFEFTPEELAYRKELKEFLDKEVTPEVVAETESLQGIGPYTKEFVRKMGAQRLMVPSWPKEYGCRGLSDVCETIFHDELVSHRGPFPLDGIELGVTIIHYGNDYLKKTFVPRVASGEIDIALGFTEPDAGSDLAALKMRAVEDGDEYIINGQKIYNTEAHHCEYHWLLTRTDPDVERHQGMSLFIVDLKSPGITIRPLYTMAGLRTNEVFYEDVRVPKQNMVGEKNQGWPVSQSSLRGEGSGGSLTAAKLRQEFRSFVNFLLNERPDILEENPWVADELARFRTFIHIADSNGYGRVRTHGPTIGYMQGQMQKEFGQFVQRVVGPYGQLARGSKLALMDGILLQQYLDGPRQTIVHGSQEIQKVLISRFLGLHFKKR